MSLSLILLCLLVLLLFPPFQRRFFSLEWGDERGENTYRWAQFVIVLFILLALSDSFGQGQKGISKIIVLSVITLSYLELVLRIVCKYLLPVLSRKTPVFAKIYQYITDNPDNLYYSNYVPHPFLQFTGPRGPVPESDGDYFLGFKDIKLSDKPKPDGVIRVACLGGSTTADGYPEFLQEFLESRVTGKTFQILNFGTMWWSSVQSTINYVLNVVDFEPDFLVLHDSCNDHHYRGFPGLRGDCSHAYRLFLIPQTAGETLYRYSLVYRIARIILNWKFPSWFRPHFEMKDIGLYPGKTFNYDPRELYIIERNIETICTLANEKGSIVCLTTMPLSGERKFGEEHDKVYRPHTRDVNKIIREKANKYRCLLADFDRLMSGNEEYFNDAVHASEKGNKMKAESVGRLLIQEIIT